jgi:hypothetical protein
MEEGPVLPSALFPCFTLNKLPYIERPTKYVCAYLISSKRCGETSLSLFTMVFQAFIVLL